MVKSISVLSIAFLLLFSFGCETGKTKEQIEIDSLRSAMSILIQDYAATKQHVYELEKEVRTIEYYHQQDFVLLGQKMDSLSKLPTSQTQSGKGWKILGAVLGEIGKRTIPGL
jgi:hypothetical protein